LELGLKFVSLLTKHLPQGVAYYAAIGWETWWLSKGCEACGWNFLRASRRAKAQPSPRLRIQDDKELNQIRTLFAVVE